MTRVKRIPEPWRSFLRDIDRTLRESVEIHCIGAFALVVLTGIPRPTADLDFIEAVPAAAKLKVLELAGDGTDLAIRHGIRLDAVTVAEYPCDYKDRLIDITPGALKTLTIKILEPHDLLLSKVSRNSPKDRDDARLIVKQCNLSRATLQRRFEAELQPYLQTAPDRTSLTMELWLEEFFSNSDD